jgi:hypothetical protein
VGDRISSHKKWFKWLKQATAAKHPGLQYVYSDGRQLAAVSEKSLHARRVSLRRRGVVSLGSNDWMGVKEYAGRFPPFAIAVPKNKPAATIVVERARLLRALTGQDEIVQLSLYESRDKVYLLELASAGAYALVFLAEKESPEGFWRPEFSEEEAGV